jgi:FAD:protein FMN transferase
MDRPPARFTRGVVGTVASLHVDDDLPPDELALAAEEVWAELDRLEALLTTFRPTSEVRRIDAGDLHLLDASPEVIEVLDACTWLEHDSGGAFHARRPDGRLDPAGYVKGWATQRAAGLLAGRGLHHWYLSVGGDLQAGGGRLDGTPWRVAVADPRTPGAVLRVLEVRDGAVATSGTSERGHHLWDGRTGAAAASLLSVTVTGPELRLADAYATTAFALGPDDGPRWVAERGYTALALLDDDTLRVAEPLPDPPEA